MRMNLAFKIKAQPGFMQMSRRLRNPNLNTERVVLTCANIWGPFMYFVQIWEEERRQEQRCRQGAQKQTGGPQ